MAENRLKRDHETREATARPQAWKPPSMLPDPTPEEGYEFRWIRTSTFGTADPSNISAKLREGYEFVKASDHPEVHMHMDADTRFKDNIVVGGLVLCKIPSEIVQQRNEYFRRKTAGQIQAVDNNMMREADPRMPLHKPSRKTEVTFGKGS